MTNREGAGPPDRRAGADVAVVGGGLAGLAAALTAAAQGLQVIVLRRGFGATAMSSGGLDFPAELPDLYGRASFTAEDVGEAARLLAGWLGGLAGSPGEAMSLLDSAGHVRRTALTFERHAAGRLDGWAGAGGAARALFIGMEGFGTFRPEWAARVAAWRSIVRPGEAAAARVPVPGLEGEAGLAAARVARALEEEGAAERFGTAVGRIAAREKADLVALPPVLGLERADKVYRAVVGAVRDACGGREVVVFELLSPPPSLPGWRLQRLLDEAARRAGVRIVSGRVTRPAEVDGSRSATGSGGAAAVGAGALLSSLEVDSHGRVWTLEARDFVLASGRFAAGGLEARGRTLCEPVFGLTVHAPPPPGWPPRPVPAGSRSVPEMVWDRFRARHPVFDAGLAVDEELRPVDEEGRPVFNNLRAAGSVIGGYNHLTDGAGSGVAATTGVRAGRLAAERLGARKPLAGGPGARDLAAAPPAGERRAES
ncbi:MAG: FAD-binding protein [Bacillota bacterium]